jgi:chromosome segregation ATPase
LNSLSFGGKCLFKGMDNKKENRTMKSWILMLLLPLLLAACATRPPAPAEEIASARSAVASAEDAGARDHAPVELREASRKLEQAMAARDREDYVAARRLAEQAEADARYAAVKARSERAQRAVSEVEQSIAELRAEIDRAMEENGGGGGQ